LDPKYFINRVTSKHINTATINLRVVLHECKTWFFALSDRKVLREILGPKGEEVTGDWTKLHNEKHYELYSTIILGESNKRERGKRDS